MMVADPRVLSNMKERNTPQLPLVKVVSDLDTQMNEVLARTELSTSEKVKLYDQTLQRQIVQKEKLTGKPAQVVVRGKKDFSDSEILRGVTKQHKKKTEELLDLIKSNSSWGWNDSGEFVYDDRAVPSSNIKDLIAATARNTNKSRLPGWNEFQKALQDFQGPQPPSTSRKRKLKQETFRVTYYDPQNPGSFGGVPSLSKVADQPAKEWLSGEETYTLHHPVRRNFQRRRIIVSGIDDQ